MKYRIFLSTCLLIFITTVSVCQSGWVIQNSGINDILRSVFFVNSNTGWACGDNGKILKTTNSGTNWILQTSGTDQNFYSMFFLNENTGWLCGGKNYTSEQPAYSDCILKTSNGGASWQIIFNAASSFPIVFTGIHFANATTGMVIGAPWMSLFSLGVIMNTYNGGANWTNFTVDSLSRYSLAFANSSTGYLGCSFFIDYADLFTYISYVYKTTNYGINWTNVYTVSEKSVTTLSCADVNNVLGGGMNITSAGVIYKTQNGGGNWLQVYPQSTGQILSVFSAGMNYAWSTTYDKKILISSNAGLNWTAQQNPVNFTLNALCFTDSLTGWTVGNSGTILKTTTGGTTGLKQFSNEIPEAYSLSQNYPNPFNPSTKIKFDIPPIGQRHAFDLQLNIYDILGRKVESLISPLRGGRDGLSPGTYEIEWNAANYPSGVYFYKLVLGTVPGSGRGAEGQLFTDTKKMVLLK